MSEEKAMEIAESADLVLNGYAVTRDGIGIVAMLGMEVALLLGEAASRRL